MSSTHTNNRMQRHWTEVREFIKENWEEITDVELDRIDGKYDQFLFYLKEFYGDVNFPKTEANARAKMSALFNELDRLHPERTTAHT